MEATCPCTPPRPSKAVNAGSELVVSPYFPQKKRKQNLSLTSEEQSLKESIDTSLFNDPLFCFYFRSFARLYHQLWLLKPALIQERVADDPWKVLIAVTLLNKTTGRVAIPVFWDLVLRYPTPLALSQANETDLTSIIRPLGLQSIRAKRLIRLSTIYLEAPPSQDRLYQSNGHTAPDTPVRSSSRQRQQQASIPPPSPSKRQRYVPTPISHIPGTGPYALDSYRIFCTSASEPDAWKHVMPMDKELIKYLKWRWAFEERTLWTPDNGIVGSVDIKDLESLIDELKT